MPDSCFNLERAYRKMKERGYDKLYFAVDLHDVIIEGKYNKFNEGRAFYPDAKDVLQFFTRSPQICFILWSSSHDDSIADIRKWLNENQIDFEYVCANPEMPSTELCDFKKKFAFDVLLEDKAGFVGQTDWTILKNKFIELGMWDLPLESTTEGTLKAFKQFVGGIPKGQMAVLLAHPTGKEMMQTGANGSGSFRKIGTREEEREYARQSTERLIKAFGNGTEEPEKAGFESLLASNNEIDNLS